MKALSKKLNGLVNPTIISLPLLLWQSTAIAQPLPTARTNPPQIQKLNKPPKPNPNYPELPCLESRSECIELLTAKAIANYPELVTLDEQITLIDRRLVVAGKRIEHTSKKRWTNYISRDPISTSYYHCDQIRPYTVTIMSKDKREQVFQACQELLEEEKSVTVRAVIDRVGGSSRDISPIVKEFKEKLEQESSLSVSEKAEVNTSSSHADKEDCIDTNPVTANLERVDKEAQLIAARKIVATANSRKNAAV